MKLPRASASNTHAHLAAPLSVPSKGWKSRMSGACSPGGQSTPGCLILSNVHPRGEVRTMQVPRVPAGRASFAARGSLLFCVLMASSLRDKEVEASRQLLEEPAAPQCCNCSPGGDAQASLGRTGPVSARFEARLTYAPPSHALSIFSYRKWLCLPRRKSGPVSQVSCTARVQMCPRVACLAQPYARKAPASC